MFQFKSSIVFAKLDVSRSLQSEVSTLNISNLQLTFLEDFFTIYILSDHQNTSNIGGTYSSHHNGIYSRASSSPHPYGGPANIICSMFQEHGSKW